MEEAYTTLKTIYDIVKNDTNPETYLCSTREIILRQLEGWDVIESHLKILEQNGLVVVKQLDRIAISITSRGIDAVISGTDHLDYFVPNADEISE
jgi:metal-dependent HD superfamily phosphatase/phosphodiesterase